MSVFLAAFLGYTAAWVVIQIALAPIFRKIMRFGKVTRESRENIATQIVDELEKRWGARGGRW